MAEDIHSILQSTFGRLIGEQHPISHARQALPANAPAQQALWQALADGGWLEAGCGDFQHEHGTQTLLLGEIVGSSLLTLPYATSAFLLAPLCEVGPGLQDLLLPLSTHPASVRCDFACDEEGWIDAYGPAAQYLRLCHEGKAGGWRLERWEAAVLEPVQALDPCVRMSRLRGEPAEQAAVAAQHVAMVLQRYLAFEFAHMLGAASAALNQAIEHAKQRVQFGRPIGQFQAVKHGLVDAWMGLDNARYAIEALLRMTVSGKVNAALAGTASRLTAQAAKLACKRCIQVHGGIGFAWEHDAHLYLKRVYRLAVTTARVQRLLEAATQAE